MILEDLMSGFYFDMKVGFRITPKREFDMNRFKKKFMAK